MNGESSVQIDRGRWLYRFALNTDSISIYRARRAGQDLAPVEVWRSLALLGISDAFIVPVAGRMATLHRVDREPPALGVGQAGVNGGSRAIHTPFPGVVRRCDVPRQPASRRRYRKRGRYRTYESPGPTTAAGGGRDGRACPLACAFGAGSVWLGADLQPPARLSLTSRLATRGSTAEAGGPAATGVASSAHRALLGRRLRVVWAVCRRLGDHAGPDPERVHRTGHQPHADRSPDPH